MQLFAHRGYSDKAPENSLTALQLALAHQADGIEVDVRLAAGQIMLMHDATLDRTTNGEGSVECLTLEQWQQLDAGDGYPPPHLEQLFALVQGQCAVNIEIKSTSVVPVLAAAIQHTCEQGWFVPEQLCVSAFDHHALVALRRYLPQHPVAPLMAACPLDYAACAEPLAAQAVHTHVETTNAMLVDDAHARGLQVRVYTVTEAEDLLRLRDLGVDAVFVNDVEWARGLLS